jgi:hypothetical protein
MPRLGVVVALLLCCVSGLGHAQSVEATLKLGQEADSNPARLDGAGSSADTAVRVFAGVDADGRLSDAVQWSVATLLAGRWFARAHDNDSVVTDARTSITVMPSAWSAWRSSLGVRDTTERRNGRDFTLLDAQSGIRLGTRSIGAQPFGGAQLFRYKPDASFGWMGPRGGLLIDGAASDRVRWHVGGDAGRRRFSDRRVAESGVVRRDDVWSLRTGLELRFPRGRLDVGYAAQWTRSNEPGKDLLRHTVSPALTMLPVGDLLVRVSGSVQRARCTGGCQLDVFARADEETRNRFGVALEHPLARDVLWVEGRYTYFAQAFEGEGTAAFARHLGMLGVSVRFGS